MHSSKSALSFTKWCACAHIILDDMSIFTAFTCSIDSQLKLCENYFKNWLDYSELQSDIDERVFMVHSVVDVCMSPCITAFCVE